MSYQVIIEPKENKSYIAYINEIDENRIIIPTNSFYEYEDILNSNLVQNEPEKYLTYKGSLKLPWEEEEVLTKSSNNIDIESLNKRITELENQVGTLDKLLSSIVKSLAL